MWSENGHSELANKPVSLFACHSGWLVTKMCSFIHFNWLTFGAKFLQLIEADGNANTQTHKWLLQMKQSGEEGEANRKPK